MSKKDVFGLNLAIGGEKEFKQALADLNRNMKVFDSELKLVTSSFDKNDQSQKRFSATAKVLSREIEEQKKKIDLLKQALDSAEKTFGNNSKQAQEWKIKLNQAQAGLNDLEREAKKTPETIKKIGDESDKSSKKLENLSNIANSSNFVCNNFITYSSFGR